MHATATAPSHTRLLPSVGAGVGAGLVATSGALHLDLWTGAYRHIPTIGPLFLAQAVSSVVVAVAIVVLRHPVVLAAGAALMAGTLGGFLISVNYGLFGFQDTINAPFGTTTLVVEAVAAVVLGGTAMVQVARRRHGIRTSR